MRIVLALCLLISLTGTAQTKLDRANWTFIATKVSDSSRFQFHGAGLEHDTVMNIIHCDTASKTISITEIDKNDGSKTTTQFKYDRIEVYDPKDPDPQMVKGVYYYRTIEQGTFEYWPGEMVVRKWPGVFYYEYNRYVTQGKKNK